MKVPFEIGIWKQKNKSTLFHFKLWEISIIPCYEGCKIFTVGPFYLTWFRGRCK